MAGIKVTITFEGLDEAISHFAQIPDQSRANLIKKTASFSKTAETAWKGVTPVRSGRLQGGDVADASDLTITFMNGVYYYVFRDQGHMTPRGWHTAHGYRLAKRRSHVGGAFMTDRLVEYIESNIGEALSSFLPDD